MSRCLLISLLTLSLRTQSPIDNYYIEYKKARIVFSPFLLFTMIVKTKKYPPPVGTDILVCKITPAEERLRDMYLHKHRNPGKQMRR